MTPRDWFKALLYALLMIFLLYLYVRGMICHNLIFLLYLFPSQRLLQWVLDSSDPRY